MLKKILPLVTVFLFAFIAVLPLLHKGLPPTHDGEYHVVRFYEFDKTLRDGSLYPRWASDLNRGYGVPLFNFVYPLPNYIASFFHFLGFSFIDAFKLNMFLASILGAVFFYLWAKAFWGRWGGMLGGVFYTFSPYHFVDIYIRGSVGEVWALAFFPAFLWCITSFVNNKKIIFFVGSCLSLSLIIFSHNILSLMFLPFSFLYIIFLISFQKDKKHLILNSLYIILLGLGLSAVFWVPAIFEKQYVVGLEVFGFENHFADLYQLIIPSWGSGFSGESLNSSLSLQIGIANLLVVFLSLFLLLIYRKNNRNSHIVLFFIVLFFVIFFLMQKGSLPIWKTVPFINYFQFPWRFLSLEILVASFLAGSVVYFWKSKILTIALIILSFFLGIGYAKVAYYHYRDDNYYLTRSNFIEGTNSPGNAFNTVYFDPSLGKKKAKTEFLKGSGVIDQQEIKSTYYKFKIEALENSEIKVNTAYFPGWSVFVNRAEVKTNITEEGLFSFYLPEGKQDIAIGLKDTPIRNIGFILFLITGAILAALFIKAMFG